MKEQWWLAAKPSVAKTHACLTIVDDHLGKSEVMVESWWSGEGWTVSIEANGKEQRFEVTDYQLKAILLSIKEIRKAEREKGT